MCPSGFHVAGVSDWQTLISNSGGEYMAGHNLKASPDASSHGWIKSLWFMLFLVTLEWLNRKYNCSSSYPRGYYWTSTETGVNAVLLVLG